MATDFAYAYRWGVDRRNSTGSCSFFSALIAGLNIDLKSFTFPAGWSLIPGCNE